MIGEIMNIVVNARNIITEETYLTYEQVAELAELNPKYKPTIVFRDKKLKVSGTLIPGISVMVSEGLMLDAAYTGNA
jgi:hypothetical protein